MDPMAEKYYPISPYVYVANNPMRFIDLNGMFYDEYGLDKNTGKLSMIKEKLDDPFDYIKVGKFNKDGSFTEDKSIEAFELPMGILKGDVFEDISKTGIIVRDIDLGADLMEFISFKIERELQATGFELRHNSKKMSEGLSISPWVFNTYRLSHIFNFPWYLGDPIFYIHTHPGKKGLEGFGFGEPSDYDMKYFKNGYDHYILSRHQGLTKYYRNGIYYTPAEKTTPPGLRKKIK